MFCKNCGKPIRDNSSFCAYCGSPVAGNMHQIEYLPNTANNNRNIIVEKIKKMRLMSIIATVMTVVSQAVAGIVILAFTAYVSSNEDNPDKIMDEEAPALFLVFVSFLIINLPSFIYFIKTVSKTNSILNHIEINFSKQLITDYFYSINKKANTFIMIINIVLMPGIVFFPLVIMQILACISISNSLNFFKTNEQYL